MEISAVCPACGVAIESTADQQTAAAAPFSYLPTPTYGDFLAFAPEYGLFWTLLCTPIVGAFVWSRNWKKLDLARHMWWTYVTGILAMVCFLLSKRWFGDYFVGYGVILLWAFALYFMQRKLVAKGRKSTSARVLSALLIVLSIAGCLDDYVIPNKVSGAGDPGATVTFGTHYDENSADSAVSGTDFIGNKEFDARLYAPQGFKTQSITVAVEKPEGNNWIPYWVQNFPTKAEQTVCVVGIKIPSGTYRVDFLNGKHLIAQNSLTLK